MKPANRNKKVQAQKPLEGTLDYELYVGDLQQEIIDLTEVVEGEASVEKGEASTTRTPAGPLQESNPMREKPGAERQTLGTQPKLRPTLVALTASAKGAREQARERRSEAKARTDETVPISTKGRSLDSGDRRAEDLEADQIFAEFFSSLDAEDLSERIPGAGGSVHGPTREEPPSNENDGFEKLLEDVESAEGVIAEERGESHSPAGEPDTTVGLQSDTENDDLEELLEVLDSAERAAVKETSESHSLARESGATAGLQKGDRGWSDTYDPPCILTLEREIIRHQEERERKISELRAQKEKLKSRSEDIWGLLYASEDQLKPAVVKLFRTHWKLKVSDLESRRTPGFKDDILVEHDGRNVIFKIKSTSVARPPIKYINQLWQELHYSGLGERVEGGLILNHDIKLDPKHRSPAYPGEEEEYLQDIIFLETRVLYHLTLAIVDYSLPLQEAKELLLRKGRGKFYLDEVAG